MKTDKIYIEIGKDEFIKLDNLIKIGGGVDTGGQAKRAIQSGQVKVNGEICLQRGKKMREGDMAEFNGYTYEVCSR